MAPTGFEVLATSISGTAITFAGILGYMFQRQVKKSNGGGLSQEDHDLLVAMSVDIKYLKAGQTTGQASRSDIRDLIITHVSDRSAHN